MKKAVSTLVALFMAFVLVACSAGSTNVPAETAAAAAPGGSKTATPADKPAEEAGRTPITLKISTAAADSETHVQALYQFKKQVEENADWITVEVYPSATLFAQDANIDAMMRGNLEMCLTSSSWLAEYVPSLNMFAAPYLFKDYEHMSAVLNGEIGKELFESVANEIGVRVIGVFYIGSRTINLTEDKEVTGRADLKGVQLRVPNSASWIYMCTALGADPIPMALSETYLGLQTGAVDGQDNPLPATMSNGFGEVTKSITMTNHIVDQVWLAISEEVWAKMDDQSREVVSAAAQAAREFCDTSNLEKIETLIPEFEAMGVTVYRPDVSAFRQEVMDYQWADTEQSGEWDADLFNKIQELAS
ncbi:MAG TPA: DctP family TRAP transporter solute-binding subunit [Feifaniaceae bacterium]|nr:DctP family TRAP transporter solute-binding subunit [Feifaniaceae bacterium]